MDFLNGYNNTYHTSIGMAPKKVTKKKVDEVWEDQYVYPFWEELQRWRQKTTKRAKRFSFRFKIGDIVKISHMRQAFDREYHQKWTFEVFTIRKRFNELGIPQYELNSYRGQPVKGRFYQSELQHV